MQYPRYGTSMYGDGDIAFGYAPYRKIVVEFMRRCFYDENDDME